jgi:hypothetical protein
MSSIHYVTAGGYMGRGTKINTTTVPKPLYYKALRWEEWDTNYFSKLFGVIFGIALNYNTLTIVSASPSNILTHLNNYLQILFHTETGSKTCRGFDRNERFRPNGGRRRGWKQESRGRQDCQVNLEACFYVIPWNIQHNNTYWTFKNVKGVNPTFYFLATRSYLSYLLDHFVTNPI